MNRNRQQPSVRRILLPSGRSIEVIRFAATHGHDDGQAPSHSGPAAPSPRPLHVCPECDSELVQPVSWNQISDEEWELSLQCPNCWCSSEGVFASTMVGDLEEQLDAGLGDMLADLKQLSVANLAEEVERFAAALQADLILPEDF